MPPPTMFSKADQRNVWESKLRPKPSGAMALGNPWTGSTKKDAFSRILWTPIGFYSFGSGFPLTPKNTS
jgi:hypothetical protein